MRYVLAAIEMLASLFLLAYHRRMAKWYAQAAASHADHVIHTQLRVPTAEIRQLRAKADAHNQKAHAIRVGE